MRSLMAVLIITNIALLGVVIYLVSSAERGAPTINVHTTSHSSGGSAPGENNNVSSKALGEREGEREDTGIAITDSYEASQEDGHAEETYEDAGEEGEDDGWLSVSGDDQKSTKDEYHTTNEMLSLAGQISYVPMMPGSLKQGGVESNQTAYLFWEAKNRVLKNDLPVDITKPSVVPDVDDYSPAVIASGTLVASYIIHFDVVGRVKYAQQEHVKATITFKNEILGIIATGESLHIADLALGRAGTEYPNKRSRQVDSMTTDQSTIGAAVQDTIALSDDLKTITVSMTSSTALDQCRVITVAGRTPGGNGTNANKYIRHNVNVKTSHVAVSGKISYVPEMPKDVSQRGIESDEVAHLFYEADGNILSDDMQVDISRPSTVPDLDEYSPATVGVGRRINSYLLHFDPVGRPNYSKRKHVSGTVTVRNEIIGIIVMGENLNVADRLVGNANTKYPDQRSRRVDKMDTDQDDLEAAR